MPVWPGARIIERNPFPFFPFNPRWLAELSREDVETFYSLLKLAWVSVRPGYLPGDRDQLSKLLTEVFRTGRSVGCRPGPV